MRATKNIFVRNYKQTQRATGFALLFACGVNATINISVDYSQ
jgi:hypothetical protein